MNEIHLNTNLKYLRISHNKTQNDIAKIINKGASAIGNYENGIRDISAEDIGILAEYFGISVEDFMLKDLRLQNSKTETKQLSTEQFMTEVLPLIDKVDKLSDRQKNKLKDEIIYICGDDK